MKNLSSELRDLRGNISSLISTLETTSSLIEVCQKLGLPQLNLDAGLSKFKMCLKMCNEVSDEQIVTIARRLINDYPGNRGMPSLEQSQAIQDNVWWIESNGKQQLSSVVRLEIAEKLESFIFWGRSPGLTEFFSSAGLFIKTFSGVRIGADGYLYQHAENLLRFPENSIISSFFQQPEESRSSPTRISVLSFLQYVGVSEWPDKKFFQFIERVVHPEVQKPEEQDNIVRAINSILIKDNFELWSDHSLGGSPIYKIRKRGAVQGSPKYIIFAPIDVKPDIVIADAINMEIELASDPEKCMIYDQPPPSSENLTWDMLVQWWCQKNKLDSNNREHRRAFGQRLRESLQSDPERFLFDTYFQQLRPKYGVNLPALLPQVYLHYDPRVQRTREKPILFRQRLDFMLILRNSTRIILEIDGSQHYSDNSGKAIPMRYAEMVREDRRIRLLGYEVYRFGGAEFVYEIERSQTIVSFFTELFQLHQVQEDDSL